MRDDQRGITLIETLLYIALFAIILTSSVGLFVQLMQGQQNTRVRGQMEQSAGLLLSHLHTSLAEASAVNTVASTFAANNGILVYADAGGNTITLDRPSVSLTLGGTAYTVRRLRLQVGAQPVEWITPPLLDVERFRVDEVLDGTGNTVGLIVSVRFQMLNPAGGVYQSAAFDSQTTVALQPSVTVL